MRKEKGKRRRNERKDGGKEKQERKKEGKKGSFTVKKFPHREKIGLYPLPLPRQHQSLLCPDGQHFPVLQNHISPHTRNAFSWDVWKKKPQIPSLHFILFCFHLNLNFFTYIISSLIVLLIMYAIYLFVFLMQFRCCCVEAQTVAHHVICYIIKNAH